jgi:small-conductance mechanosensitive channel
VWDFNVSKYEEITPTGAKNVRTVQLGTIIKALVFFGVAYWILARISRRMQRLVVSRIHMGEAQANTLRTWVMIVVGFGLAIATLNFLSIPLTLFAFFGGALAIGLGFGTQTLIKNFISGIIVLFERKIRVGDVVDIGGVSGTITEINTRSSVLRGGDGKETLVPNSLFLENRVTNLTLSNRRVRRLVTIRVSAKAAPHLVSVILKECAERHGLILKDPAPYVTLEDIVENANIFGIYYWTEFNDKTNADVVASDLRFMAEKRIGELVASTAAEKLEEPPAAKPADNEAAPFPEETPPIP